MGNKKQTSDRIRAGLFRMGIVVFFCSACLLPVWNLPGGLSPGLGSVLPGSTVRSEAADTIRMVMMRGIKDGQKGWYVLTFVNGELKKSVFHPDSTSQERVVWDLGPQYLEVACSDPLFNSEVRWFGDPPLPYSGEVTACGKTWIF